MNSLQRNIKRNEVVVLKKEIFRPEYRDLKYRLFQVISGFGMQSFTTGTALYGRYIDGNIESREHGMDIDKNETEGYQKGDK